MAGEMNDNNPVTPEANPPQNEGNAPAQADNTPSTGLNIPKTDGKSPTDKTADTQAKEVEQTPPADFDYSAYESEFLSTGDISKNSREQLYKSFPKNLVDNYIENMKAAYDYSVSQSEQKAYEVTGGKDGYLEMTAWASKNLSEDEIEAFNEAVNSGNEKWALQAIKGLYARKSLDGAGKPKITLGGTANGVSGDVFLTRQDYANAVADEKYSNSPQYRAEIEAKLANTLKRGGFVK